MVEALTLNFGPDSYKILKPFSMKKKAITKKELVNIVSNQDEDDDINSPNWVNPSSVFTKEDFLRAAKNAEEIRSGKRKTVPMEEVMKKAGLM
ncbi:MAG: hypothetical protein Ta2D_08940 [Rickettsiales bacterium]|nr:MAG: hypothetical protein Ta2D_08940 [Rickettsiales bacterium]